MNILDTIPPNWYDYCYGTSWTNRYFRSDCWWNCVFLFSITILH